jgi:predicted ferric reductase
MLICHVLIRLVDAGLSWDMLSVYLLPGKYWPYTFGLFGFVLFAILIFFTTWIKLPYQLWLWTHKFLGLAFVLGGVHAWMSVSAFSEFQIYRTILVVIWALGSIAFLYKWIFYDIIGPKTDSTVDLVQSHDNITEIYLKIHNHKFRFHTGQFVFINATHSVNMISKEVHPFSISGFYNGNILRVSAKNLGDFTSTLPKLSVGDAVTITGPYGKFGHKLITSKRNAIWIAGGIGIAPFLQMLQHENLAEKATHAGRKIDFFVVVKDEKENVYGREIQVLSEGMTNVKVFNRYSNTQGRLTGQDVLNSLENPLDIKNMNIFICGPVGMMLALSEQFQALGVKDSQIIFEEFQLA